LLRAFRSPTIEETAIVSVALLTWALALLAVATGNGRFADHHALMGRRTLPWALGLLSFLATWQVMIAAMMLPTSLPMIRLFARASGGQRRAGLVRAMFVAAYFAVWTGFAVFAWMCDAALHALAVRAGWPGDHPAAIMGGALLLAGLFQFSKIKERCLHECRHPASFLLRWYQRGPGAAWALGVRHGLFCLGCCWGLMLLMFAVGVAGVAWMALLTGMMLFEKMARWGKRLVPVVGLLLLLWGNLVLLQPGWLPTALRGDTMEHVQHHMQP
jgi:predicted metal-binding membrane protein